MGFRRVLFRSREVEELQQQLDCKEAELAYLRGLRNRPKTIPELITWVETSFAGKLMLHPKAVGLLEALREEEVDLGLVCDGLEYLAQEYRDWLLQRISENQLRNLCAQKYNRGFVVTPTGDGAISRYPTEYRIKYYKGYSNKPKESELNLHLKCGNDNRFLVRIYFLYDKDKKLIVVGSLPKHLSTLTY